MGGKVYASILGLLSPKPPFVHVIPLSGRYIPKPDDVVIGTVTDAQGTFWLLDIGAPRWAPLHMTGTPWNVEIGETEKFLRVRDSVIVRVENLDPTGRIGVTMLGDGLGKLDGGTIVTVSPARIPRVVGRGGSMIETITKHTGAQIAVGQNGRVWINGSPDAMLRASEALRLIEDQGHRRGLTERVESYLVSTSSSSDRGPEAPPRESAHRDAEPTHVPPVGPADERIDPESVGPAPDEY